MEARSDRSEWLALVDEPVIEAGLPICDAHHHLWLDNGHSGFPYPVAGFNADTGAGHNVVRSVFLECNAEYYTDGPEHLRPVGETAFVVRCAEESRQQGGTEIAAIMGHADVMLGDAVEEVLAAHDAVGNGLFRGIRYIAAYDEDPKLRMRVPGDALQNETFRAGVRTVGRMGFTFDTMVYHPQLSQLADMARACPETTIVADHLCAPLAVGPYLNRRDEVLVEWRKGMTELASCPNVRLKLGGIGMPMFGLRWDKGEKPPTSAELAAPWRDEFRHCIDAFGPDRCLFESNFPMDKRGCSYLVLWNAFKRIAADYSQSEKRDLFHDTAARTYRVQTLA